MAPTVSATDGGKVSCFIVREYNSAPLKVPPPRFRTLLGY